MELDYSAEEKDFSLWGNDNCKNVRQFSYIIWYYSFLLFTFQLDASNQPIFGFLSQRKNRVKIRKSIAEVQ